MRVSLSCSSSQAEKAEMRSPLWVAELTRVRSSSMACVVGPKVHWVRKRAMSRSSSSPVREPMAGGAGGGVNVMLPVVAYNLLLSRCS